MHWLLLVISVVFALAAAATVAVPEDVPEPATQPAAPGAKPPAAEVHKIADEGYKRCLNDWDAAAHMTKKEWQRTCRRVADNRAKFRVHTETGERNQPPSE